MTPTQSFQCTQGTANIITPASIVSANLPLTSLHISQPGLLAVPPASQAHSCRRAFALPILSVWNSPLLGLWLSPSLSTGSYPPSTELACIPGPQLMPASLLPLFPFCFFFFFFWLYPWHMEVPRLGVELELQLPSYATATATWDPSHICILHRSLLQCWIINTLGKARD